jgi:hypothetical protein
VDEISRVFKNMDECFENIELPCRFDLKGFSYFNDEETEEDVIKLICSIRKNDHDTLYSMRGCAPDGEMGCDAECYIEDIDSPESLIDCEIIEIEPAYKESYELCGNTVEPWAIKIRTNKGYCTIDMRLEHNGYYYGVLRIEKLEDIPKDMICINNWEKYKGRE